MDLFLPFVNSWFSYIEPTVHLDVNKNNILYSISLSLSLSLLFYTSPFLSSRSMPLTLRICLFSALLVVVWVGRLGCAWMVIGLDHGHLRRSAKQQLFVIVPIWVLANLSSLA